MGRLGFISVVVLKMFPLGYSYGSDIASIFLGPQLGYSQLVGRMLHIIAAIFLVVLLFAPPSTTRRIILKSGSKMLESTLLWSEDFHYDFASANLAKTGIVFILCSCDISMVQMLPWKDTPHYKESRGFASASLMTFAVCVDLVQKSVSGVSYLLNLIESSMQANDDKGSHVGEAAFNFLAFIVDLLYVIVDVLILYCWDGMKQRVVEALRARGDDAEEKEKKEKEKEEERYREDEEAPEKLERGARGGGNGDGDVSGDPSSSISSQRERGTHTDTAHIEMEQVYPDRCADDEEGGIVQYSDNPLHNTAAAAAGVGLDPLPSPSPPTPTMSGATTATTSPATATTTSPHPSYLRPGIPRSPRYIPSSPPTASTTITTPTPQVTSRTRYMPPTRVRGEGL